MNRAERILVAALCAIVGWFYFWTVQSNGEPWDFGREQSDYHNLLIDGWLDGHLHMKVKVPEELLRLPDPYDPKLRPPGLGLHDATFYRGKYYLYFGAAPIVTVMLPWRLLTGTDLPLAAAVLVFCYGGFLASVAAWLAVRRRFFPGSGIGVMVMAVLVLGIASLAPVVLRRPHMWELPIAAGSAFAMAAVAAIFLALHSPRRRAWLAIAGLALGLAIASRPSYLIAAPLFLAPLAWWRRSERRLPWREALAAALPAAAVGALMAWHNFARFGDPLQFGQAYQFSGDYESQVTHFSARYWGFNLWRYFFSAADWTDYFPFIRPAVLPPKPPGFSGHDDVFGVLTNLPIAWLALAAPLALWRREAAERGPLGAWLAGVAVLFATMAATMVSFFGSLGRYLFDFTPALMLLAAVGGLAVERRLADARWRRAAAGVAGGALAGFSLLFAVLYSLQFSGFLRERNAPQHHELARLLNRVAAWLEPLRGARHGAVDLSVRVAPGEPGRVATLLSLPLGAAAPDRVMLRHEPEGRVAIGFVPGSGRETWSRPLAVDFARELRVAVAAGSLYPPSSHPGFAGLTALEAAMLRRRVRIAVGGETVIDERRFFPGDDRAELIPGEAVASMARRAFMPGDARRLAAREHLRLRLRAEDAGEALVRFSAGGPAVTLRRVDPASVRFGWRDAAGGPSAEGENVRWPAGAVREVLLTLSGDGRELIVEVERAVMWSRACALPPRSLREAGVPAAALMAERYSAGDYPLGQGGAALALRVTLPRDRAGRREPLLVTGRPGAGNFLCIEYLDAGAVRFAFDHWGQATLFSERLPVDFGATHDIEVAWGAWGAAADSTRRNIVPRGRLAVRLNGRTVWETTHAFYVAEPEDVFVGREPLGATTCDARFTGEILSAARAGR